MDLPGESQDPTLAKSTMITAQAKKSHNGLKEEHALASHNIPSKILYVGWPLRVHILENIPSMFSGEFPSHNQGVRGKKGTSEHITLVQFSVDAAPQMRWL